MNTCLSGNEAVAYAMKQVDPDVFGAFPITPSTDIPECFSQYVADGTVHTEFVTVESEHSSMSVCLAACDKVDLTAPTNSTVTLTTSQTAPAASA